MDSVCMALVANNFYMPHEEAMPYTFFTFFFFYCLIATVCCLLSVTRDIFSSAYIHVAFVLVKCC